MLGWTIAGAFCWMRKEFADCAPSAPSGCGATTYRACVVNRASCPHYPCPHHKRSPSMNTAVRYILPFPRRGPGPGALVSIEMKLFVCLLPSFARHLRGWSYEHIPSSLSLLAAKCGEARASPEPWAALASRAAPCRWGCLPACASTQAAVSPRGK